MGRDPPAIHCCSTSFLPLTGRLLSSQDVLAREVLDSTLTLRRSTSLSILFSSQPKLKEWTKERLHSLWDRAWRVAVRRNDLVKEFLESRSYPRYENDGIWGWRDYQENRERRHYWGQVLCGNYDWDWDLSRSLKRLFRRPRADVSSIGTSGVKGSGRIDWISGDRVPELLTVEYRTPTGEIKYKTFRADPSLEDVTAETYSTNARTSTPGEMGDGLSSPGGRIEYVNVIEYRDVNRHARRKIEAWLNDEWSVSWKWNGLHDYKWGDSRWKSDSDEYRSVHWMVLERSKTNLLPSPSNKKIKLKFPKTPKPPLGPLSPGRHAMLYSDSDPEGCSDSDSK